jgi:hypothetical protein
MKPDISIYSTGHSHFAATLKLSLKLSFVDLSQAAT